MAPPCVARYPHSTLCSGQRPHLPHPGAANSASKLMMKLAKVGSVGLILLSMAHPIHLLQCGGEVVGSAKLTALAVRRAGA